MTRRTAGIYVFAGSWLVGCTSLLGLDAIEIDASEGGAGTPTGSGGIAAGAGGSTSTSTPSGGGGADTTTTSSGTTTGSGTTTSTATGGAPPCSGQSLGDFVRITEVSLDVAAGGRALTAEAGWGTMVAWAAGDGTVHVTPLDAVDVRLGPDLSVEGTQVYGVAASATDVALIVSRSPDYMTFVRLGIAGNVLATTNLVGGGDHAVIGTEWFGEFARTGRLVAQGDGSYAAYHALHRRWPDNVGHQGDTLRVLDAAGANLGGWGWGCSHSLDQRLASGPVGLITICASDCYPGKGIYFQNSVEITPDPAANCAGGYTTELGGLVALADSFFLVYGDAQGNAHLGHFDEGAGLIADRSLSVPGSSRLARYGDGLLLGSDNTTLQMLDLSGQDVGAPANVAVALPDSDFEGRSNGEVAWAVAAGASLTVVRVRLCE